MDIINMTVIAEAEDITIIRENRSLTDVVDIIIINDIDKFLPCSSGGKSFILSIEICRN